MHYVQDDKEIANAKEAVDDAKREIEIANIEKEIDLLEDQKDLLNEQIDLIDEQIEKINEYYDNLIADTEKYWDNLIKGMEDYKSRWEELAEIEEHAKIIETLKALGIETDDILGMSEEAFARFKDEYISILADIYSGNDSMLSALSDTTGKSVDEMGSYIDATQGYIDSLSGIGESLNPVSETIDDVAESMGSLSSTASEANTNVSKTASSVSDVATNIGDLETNLGNVNTLISAEQTAFSNLKTKISEVIEAINLKTEAIQEEQTATGIATSSEMADFLLLKEKILEVKETLESFGTPEEGIISDIVSAIQSLNDINLDEGLIAQFTSLKEAIEQAASAISGGGSSGGEGQSASSGSAKGGESAGKGSQNSGSGNSLTGAITEIGNTAGEVIGEPDSEGDGTVIGEFSALETAVTDVTTAIGGGDAEGKSPDEGGSDNLIGSIVNLGEQTEEELGESGGDGIIGRFEEFRDVIGEADEHVHGISDGLSDIDGKEAECTIKVNIETNGGLPAFADGTLGNMNLESGEYTAKYGKAFAEGTGKYNGLPHAEKNALVSEYGQTEMTVLPDGKTIITDEPTLMDLPKDTVIYNEEQTKKIMDNKVDVTGNAHVNGTAGNMHVTDTKILADEIAGMSYWQRMEKCAEALGRTMEEMLNPLNSIALDIKKDTGMGRLMSSINNVSNVNTVTNNRNVQQPVVTQNITLNCPNVTNNSGIEYIQKELGHLSLMAIQEPLRRY